MGVSLGTLKSRLARGRMKLIEACKYFNVDLESNPHTQPMWPVSSSARNPARTA